MHRAAYEAEQRRRRPQEEQERLDGLAGLDRSPEQEREFLMLSWATDYADHAAGLRAAGEMADAGLAVNWALNQAISGETRREPPGALTGACRGLGAPVLLVQGEDDPRPVVACDSLAAALPSARRVVLAAGHLPWVEAPEHLGAALRGFLAGVTYGDASGG